MSKEWLWGHGSGWRTTITVASVISVNMTPRPYARTWGSLVTARRRLMEVVLSIQLCQQNICTSWQGILVSNLLSLCKKPSAICKKKIVLLLSRRRRDCYAGAARCRSQRRGETWSGGRRRPRHWLRTCWSTGTHGCKSSRGKKVYFKTLIHFCRNSTALITFFLFFLAKTLCAKFKPIHKFQGCISWYWPKPTWYGKVIWSRCNIQHKG